MIMDFGGMKGYLADRVADIIKKRGITSAIIAVAGDIWVLGRRENGDALENRRAASAGA